MFAKAVQKVSANCCSAQRRAITVFVVSAIAEEDVDVVVLGTLKASAQGKKLLFQTAAAFVSARLGISPTPHITARKLQLDSSSGRLIVAGSYVPKTTAQLKELITTAGHRLTVIEPDVNKLLVEDFREQELECALRATTASLLQPRDVSS